MGDTDIWKYCTSKQCQEMLLEWRLLGNTGMNREKQLACLYGLSNHAEEHYRLVKIKSRSGKIRQLQVPDGLLMKVQRNILHGILDSLPVSEYAMAYRKGYSVRDNACRHTGSKQVLAMDITDYFGNITFFQVRQNVFASPYFPGSVGTLLTHLCCYKDYLPQGAATSGAISNLVMKNFDASLGEWCRKQGITYSRYCDDMTFSGEFDPRTVRNKVKSYLRILGFEVNEKKTRVQRAGVRQSVTGIVVNEKEQTPKEYRQHVRQELYYSEKYGAAAHLEHCRNMEFYPWDSPACARFLAALLGKVNYILQLQPGDREFVRARAVLRRLLEEKDIISLP